MTVGLNEFHLIQICTYRQDPWSDEAAPEAVTAALAGLEQELLQDRDVPWPNDVTPAAVTSIVHPSKKQLAYVRVVRFAQAVAPEMLPKLYELIDPFFGDAMFHVPTAEHGTLSAWTTAFAVGRCSQHLYGHFADVATRASTTRHGSDAEGLWHEVPLGDGRLGADSGYAIRMNRLGNRALILADEPVEPIVAALTERAFCRAEAEWQNASAHRQEFVEAVRLKLANAYRSLKEVTREILADPGDEPRRSLDDASTFAEINDAIADLHLTRHALHQSNQGLQAGWEHVSSAPLRAIIGARCDELDRAIEDTDEHLKVYPSLAHPAMENAKWAASQRGIKASERVSKNIAVLQIILVIAAIWPQTAATFLDRDTGDIPVWATSMRAFFLVMFVPFLLMSVAAYFVIQPIFARYVRGPVSSVLHRAAEWLSRPPRGSGQS